MQMYKVLLPIVLLSVVYHVGDGAKILGVFPTMAKSHYIAGSALMKGLAKAGHEVTMVSAFPMSKPLANWRDVEITGLFERMKAVMEGILDLEGQSIWQSINSIYDMGYNITEHVMNDANVVRLLKSNEKFDLVICELFVNEAMLGFGQHFNAPVIAMSTFGASKWTTDLVGSPSPLSYVPHPFLSFTDRMSFVERFGNTMMAIFETTFMNIMYYPRQAELYRAAFPNAKVDFDQVMRTGVSFVLLNSHFSLSHARPYLPNMVEVGGMHIKRKPDPLPTDIKTFLDNATEGVVYFSLGSNIQSKYLPAEKRDAILRTFAKLKQKVMWKWEDENLPGKPDNVFVQKWWPQDDILAHPNVKVFITHGGLLSSTEAIFHGVPVIGVPFFGDQDLNMARANRAGYGLTVRYTNLTEQALTWALTEMLGNPSYAKNMKGFSARFRDQPATPLDTAIYWVEYIIRHKGAPHMQSAGQELTFFQYHNLDVFGVMLAMVVFVYLALKMCLCGGSKKPVKSTTSTKKRN